jgi:hypothetical protein
VVRTQDDVRTACHTRLWLLLLLLGGAWASRAVPLLDSNNNILASEKMSLNPSTQKRQILVLPTFIMYIPISCSTVKLLVVVVLGILPTIKIYY